jgi:hypothetical protein
MSKDLRTNAGIAVTPILKNGTTTVCEIDALAGGSSHVKGGIIKLDRKKSYSLRFEIQPTTNFPNLSFEATGAEAFWCNPTTCPTNTGLGGFLTNPGVSTDKKVLTVDVDPSSTDGMVFYRLNFADGTNCDPIIIHN